MKPHEIEAVLLRDVREKEFCQTVKNFLASLVPVLSRNPQYQNQAIIERLIEPERIITFRVPWTDDSGRIRVNRGYRVEMSSVLGPYTGCVRFHPSVSQSILKLLAFEQIFANRPEPLF